MHFMNLRHTIFGITDKKISLLQQITDQNDSTLLISSYLCTINKRFATENPKDHCTYCYDQAHLISKATTTTTSKALVAGCFPKIYTNTFVLSSNQLFQGSWKKRETTYRILERLNCNQNYENIQERKIRREKRKTK